MGPVAKINTDCSVGPCINLLFTGRLFHNYTLDESVCCFRGVESILSLLFYF